MKILTLCDSCRELLSEHYSVKPYFLPDAQTKPQKKCEQCHKSCRDLKMFVVKKKGL